MSQATKPVVNIDRAALKQGLKDGTIHLVDVREANEFALGHIPGAVSVPLSTMKTARLTFPMDKTVVFACAAGVRSIHAINACNERGLAFNTHYAGGFRDWSMNGEAIEK